MNCKHMLSHKLLLATLALGANALLTACSDETKESVTKSDNGGYVENPTTDQLDAVYSGKTLLLGTTRSEINGAIASRIMNPTTEVAQDLSAVVLTKGAKSVLSVKDVPTLMLAFENNASFVFVGNNDSSALIDTVKVAMNNAEAQGESTETYSKFIECIESSQLQLKNDSTDNNKVIGFRLNSSYASNDASADQSNGQCETKTYSESGDTTTTRFAIDDAEPNAYQYGLYADDLVNWLKAGDDNGENSIANDGTKNYERVVYSHFTPALKKSLSAKFTYDVTSYYNPTTDCAYYIVHFQPKFNNSELTDNVYRYKMITHSVDLGNGKTIAPSYSDEDADYNTWYGPYLKGIYVKAYVDATGKNGEEFSISNPTPDNDIQAKGTKVSLTFSPGEAYPTTPQVASHELNSKDIVYKLEKDIPANEAHIGRYVDVNLHSTTAVDWTFSGEDLNISGFFKDKVKDFQWHDWSTSMAWVVTVKHPVEEKVYYVHIPVSTIIDEYTTGGHSTSATRVSTISTDNYDLMLPRIVNCLSQYHILVSSTSSAYKNDVTSWISANEDRMSGDVTISFKKGLYSYANSSYGVLSQAKSEFKKYAKALQEIAEKQSCPYKFSIKLVNSTALEEYLDSADIVGSAYTGK